MIVAHAPRLSPPLYPPQNKNAGGIHLTGTILALFSGNRSTRKNFSVAYYSARIEVLGSTSYSALIEVLRTTTSWDEPSTMEAWDTRVILASFCS